MGRLSRAEQQEQTRSAVLGAAREEFAEHGFIEAKVDRIADRADLTRGAVYSNFPGKRALYLAVLVDDAERSRSSAAPQAPSGDAGTSLGAFARVWLERLPFTGDTDGTRRLRARSLTGLLDTEALRTASAEVAGFEALLLALALESQTQGRPMLRQAELALTLLHGAASLAETAYGFGDAFDLTCACEHLADIDLPDTDGRAHLPYAPPAVEMSVPWTPPTGVVDEVSGDPVDLTQDGVIALLGVGRLSSAQDAVCSARPDDQVTIVVETDDAGETGLLARFRIIDAVTGLRRTFAPKNLPRLRLVLDDGSSAAALGEVSTTDHTEIAFRVRDGRPVARSDGRGAAHTMGAYGRDADL